MEEESSKSVWILVIGIAVVLAGIALYFESLSQDTITQTESVLRTAPTDDENVPKGAPHLNGTRLKVITDSDRRYYVLQRLQRICNNEVATRYGQLEVRGRNYCACIATKELAAMNADAVGRFEETGRIKLDKTQQNDMVTACIPQ